MRKVKQRKLNKKRVFIAMILLLLIVLLAVVANKTSITKNDQIAKNEFIDHVYIKDGISITSSVITETPNTPVLGAGMIPIKYDTENSSWRITNKNDTDWYNYAEGKLATVMLSDGYYKSELEVGINADLQLVTEDKQDYITQANLGTIYVWIPRIVFMGDKNYGYIAGTSIVNVNDTLVPDCFEYAENDLIFTGIWVEYTPQSNKTETDTKVTNMSKEDNDYGLIKNELVEPIANSVLDSVKRIQKGKPSNMQQIQSVSNKNRTMLRVVNTDAKIPLMAEAKISNDGTRNIVTINVTYNINPIINIVSIDSEENVILSNNNLTATTYGLKNGEFGFAVIDSVGNIVTVSARLIGIGTPDIMGFRVDRTYIVMYANQADEKGNYTEYSTIPLEDILKKGYITDSNNALVSGNIDWKKVFDLQNQLNATWYDYKNQKWANIVTRNSGNVAYFTWIPRYVYKLDNNAQVSYVTLVTTQNRTEEGTEVDLKEWTLPEAFTWWDNKNNEVQLPGFWVSKYNLSGSNQATISANVTAGANKIKVNSISHTGTTVGDYDLYLYTASDSTDLILNIEGEEILKTKVKPR